LRGCHTPQGAFVTRNRQRKGRRTILAAHAGKLACISPDGDPESGFSWKKEDIVEYLKTGRTARVAASGMMALVIAMSTQYLTDQI